MFVSAIVCFLLVVLKMFEPEYTDLELVKI